MERFGHGISNNRLLENLRQLLDRGRCVEIEIIAHLGEVDARRLYLEQACPSMFHYCVHVLRLAEGVAYKRIAVARAARRFPEILAALENGDLHLTAASLLAPHLHPDCAAEWLAAARHKSTHEIKRWIADRRPKADVATSVRKASARRACAETLHPAPTNKPAPNGVEGQPATTRRNATPRLDASTALAPDRSAAAAVAARPVAASDLADRNRGRCEPLGTGRYCVRFTIDAAVHEELQELRALLRHQVPDGDVAVIVGRAVHALLEQARKQKRGARLAAGPAVEPAIASAGSSVTATAELSSAAQPEVASKRPSRRIPVAVRHAVWERDDGRCSYVSREGRRCGTRDFLEFHHEVPWARCREHRARNIHLRCRAHNQHAAELDFGAEHMAVYRKRRSDFAATANEVDAKRAGSPDPQLDLHPVGAGVVGMAAAPEVGC